VAKAWGGRFHQATDTRVEAFTESISFDRRLYAVDIRGSMAHATMLASVGLITAEERDQICSHLDQIGEEIAAGQFTFRQDLEDIRSEERRVGEECRSRGSPYPEDGIRDISV